MKNLNKTPKYYATDEFLKVCQSGGIVLDTNLLILYFVGCQNPKKISNHPRLNKYNEEDYIIINSLVRTSKNKKLFLTPQTIPETMFFLGHDPKESRNSMLEELLAMTIEKLKVSNEDIYTPTPEIVKNREAWEINQYGLPDLSFIDGIKKKSLAFLSDDSELVAYMFNEGIVSKNYNEYKSDMKHSRNGAKIQWRL